MNVVTYGQGYLGQAFSSWLANIGHKVTTIGWFKDVEKIEPDLLDQIERMRRLGRLRDSGPDLYRIETAEVVWFTFDTPITPKGEADVDFVVRNMVDLCDYVHESVPILISSQVPVGTMAKLEAKCPKHKLAYIPENVRVGRACGYLMFPDRFIVGTRHIESIEPVVQALINSMQHYRPSPIPILMMSPESAECVKHVINCFLATCISFSNEMSQIVSAVGADPGDVTRGIQSEQRIGDKLPLKPGGPFKTGHLERDLRYVFEIAWSKLILIPTLRGVSSTNNRLKREQSQLVQPKETDFALACSICETTKPEIVKESNGFRLWCAECGAQTEVCSTTQEAVNDWNGGKLDYNEPRRVSHENGEPKA